MMNNALPENGRLTLPQPRYDSDVSVEAALQKRRSVRRYASEALTLGEVAQLLWAGQGINRPGGKRTAPSAGATYPLELYVLIGSVEGVSQGVYHYRPHQHELVRVLAGDKREILAKAALGGPSVARAAVDFVITAVHDRTTNRYGSRGVRYVAMEVGHAAQNIHLQAAALRLGIVVIGVFDDSRVKEVLKLPRDEEPLYIMPVGREITG